MVESLEYMFLQSAYHLIKPQVLHDDLVHEQNFDENKVGRKSPFDYPLLMVGCSFDIGAAVRRAVVDEREGDRRTTEDLQHRFTLGERTSHSCSEE